MSFWFDEDDAGGILYAITLGCRRICSSTIASMQPSLTIEAERLYFLSPCCYITTNFPRYDCDQEAMFRALLSASSDFAKRHDLPVIPSGNVIQALRKYPEFDIRQGGLSLCRDGFHMSLDYGRYAVAATWVEMLTGADVRGNGFRSEEMRWDYVSLIQNTVHEVCAAQKIKNSET